jgi:hypothetical protein
MAYIVGLLDKEEVAQLEARGWDLEDAPAQLVPDDMPLEDRGRMKMVWVDASMFEIMSGPDWDASAAGDAPATTEATPTEPTPKAVGDEYPGCRCCHRGQPCVCCPIHDMDAPRQTG